MDPFEYRVICPINVPGIYLLCRPFPGGGREDESASDPRPPMLGWFSLTASQNVPVLVLVVQQLSPGENLNYTLKYSNAPSPSLVITRGNCIYIKNLLTSYHHLLCLWGRDDDSARTLAPLVIILVAKTILLTQHHLSFVQHVGQHQASRLSWSDRVGMCTSSSLLISKCLQTSLLDIVLIQDLLILRAISTVCFPVCHRFFSFI